MIYGVFPFRQTGELRREVRERKCRGGILGKSVEGWGGTSLDDVFLIIIEIYFVCIASSS